MIWYKCPKLRIRTRPIFHWGVASDQKASWIVLIDNVRVKLLEKNQNDEYSCIMQLYSSLSITSAIRIASRQLVRELGFMRPDLADTNMSPSQVHAIIEIGNAEANNANLISAKDLAEILCLEKSSVSRLVAKLIESGDVVQTASKTDSRTKNLFLSGAGKKRYLSINQFADRQVGQALNKLSNQEQRCVLDGLNLYSKALVVSDVPEGGGAIAVQAETNVVVGEGHIAGLLGRIVEIHANYYHVLVGFGVEFECKVASEFAEYLGRWQDDQNAMWHVMVDEVIAGSLVIDGQSLGDNTALLRWFIIDDVARGSGVGNQLMAKAIAFCDQQGFDETHLWTFKGLDAARRLYEKFDFVLVEEKAGSSWGREVIEQKFVRKKK